MNQMPETTIYEVPYSRICRTFNGENNVDIVGVHSSILCTPTILSSTYGKFAKFPSGSQNLRDRFWAKVDIREETECWPWTGAKTGNGYGNFKAVRRTNIPSHRAAYWLSTGVYPDRLLVRHKCDNPICCNPSHLELGTAVDNAQDKVKRGRHRNGHTGPLPAGHRIGKEQVDERA